MSLVLNANISNPNLLDNSWFTVNQRAVTSYDREGIYGLDRWWSRMQSPGTQAINIIGNTVKMTQTSSSSGNLYLEQRMELADDDVIGMPFTVSVMYDDKMIIRSGIITGTTEYDYIQALDEDDGVWATFVKSSASNLWCFRVGFSYMKTGTHVFKAVKLEYGSVSTLANDRTPDYRTELSKCQRYYLKFQNAPWFVGWGNAASLATQRNMLIHLSSPMRATPTIKGTCNAIIGNGVYTNVSINNLSVLRMQGTELIFNFQHSNTAMENHCIAASFASGLELSADL